MLEILTADTVNRRDLHFNSLRAFEAAARHQSLSKAAEELCVTHSAVSHQIKRLEDSLDLSLFHRSNRGIQLTGAGETLLPVLVDAFDKIQTTLEGFSAKSRRSSLTITTTPAFASKWLIPRLHGWNDQKANPRIHLLPTLNMLELKSNKVDIAIRCGIPPWPGLKSDYLLSVHMTPICSPTFLSEHGPLAAPSDVFKYNLIHADIGSHPLGEEWRTWLRTAGVSTSENLEGLSFNDPWLATQAAVDGIGLAMGYVEFIQNDLLSGRLVRPFDIQVQNPLAYHLVYPKDRQNDPKIRAFRDWIKEEAGA